MDTPQRQGYKKNAPASKTIASCCLVLGLTPNISNLLSQSIHLASLLIVNINRHLISDSLALSLKRLDST
jgi:hypothetical protein